MTMQMRQFYSTTSRTCILIHGYCVVQLFIAGSDLQRLKTAVIQAMIKGMNPV